MPIFVYEALSNDGRRTSGDITADTSRDAREQLRKRNLYVTSLALLEEKQGSMLRLPKFVSGKRLYQIALSTRQLSTLMSAGIPLADALAALMEQMEDAKMKRAFRDVRERITQGVSFTDALSAHPRYFDRLYTSMVRAGETSGNLDTVLARVADFYQAQHRMRGRVAAALVYPMVMAVVGLGVVIFLMSYVVPRIVLVFKAREHEISLPLPTQVLILTSEFFETFWWLIPIAAFGAYLLIKGMKQSEKGRLFWDSLELRIPVLGPLFKKQAVSRFAVTFSSLLSSGLPALQCLTVVKDVVNNLLLSRTIDEVRKCIMEGTDIATPLRRSRVFPPVVAYMVAVGEQAGELESMLTKVAESYDEEIEMTSRKIISMVEPAIIVCMAAVVGFIVLAIILPILTMSQIRH